MSAPSRQSETTLVADATSLTASAETTFAWDISGAYYGRLTLTVTFPGSGYGNIDVYQAISESSNSGDYPARAQSIYLGSVPASASGVISQSFDCYQGLSTIRLWNNGTSAATATRTRGRLYI